MVVLMAVVFCKVQTDAMMADRQYLEDKYVKSDIKTSCKTNWFGVMFYGHSMASQQLSCPRMIFQSMIANHRLLFF
eukprot:922761-Amphidinium_carterae.1